MRRFLIVITLALLLALPIVAGALASAGRPGAPPGLLKHNGQLDEGEAIFWTGHVAAGSNRVHDWVFNPTGCTLFPDACVDRTFRVGASSPGAALRVAFDMEDMEDFFTLQLLDPSGEIAAESAPLWSTELWVSDPAEGEWTARLRVERAYDATYRMRARLEPPVTGAPQGTHALLPNLRAEPPNDFRFALPAPYLGEQFLSTTPYSCLPDEVAEEGARRCLRFSFGYGNWGDGPYHVRFSPLADAATGAEPRVEQVIFHADGTTSTRPAGTYVYHKTHMHYHYEGIFEARLFRVDDPQTGSLTEVGATPKRGACAHDWKIVAWDSFIQEKRGASDSGDGCDVRPLLSPPSGAFIALSRGWADIYPWMTPMNYLEFSSHPDGCYLVLATADPDDQLLETREDDNHGYALIEVQGDAARMLERGRGTSPWDPAKEVVEARGSCGA